MPLAPMRFLKLKITYCNLGGIIVGSEPATAFTKVGYIAFKPGGWCAGTQSSIILAECKIASN